MSKNLEHTIRGILSESVGISGTEKYKGIPPSFATAYRGKGVSLGAARNRILNKPNNQQPYGNFQAEDGKAINKSIVPNQGDAPTEGELSSRGVAEGGKKKKIKEDADTNTELIKKGSLRYAGPLTKYTNPLGQTEPPKAAQPVNPSPTLSFQTPDLSAGKADETKVPKLSKLNGKEAKNMSVQPNTSDTVSPYAKQSVLDKAEKAANELLGIPGAKAQAIAIPSTAMTPPPVGASSSKSRKSSTIGAKAHADQQSKDILNGILGGGGMTTYNPPIRLPGAATTDKITGAQLQTPPAQKQINPPAAAGLDVKDSNKDYAAPSDTLQPHKFTDSQTSAQKSGSSGAVKPGTTPAQSTKPTEVVGPNARPGDGDTLAQHSKIAADVHTKAHERRNDALAGNTPSTMPPMNAATPQTAGVAGAIQTQQPAQARAGASTKTQDKFTSDEPAKNTKPRVEFQQRAATKPEAKDKPESKAPPATDTKAPTGEKPATADDIKKGLDKSQAETDKGLDTRANEKASSKTMKDYLNRQKEKKDDKSGLLKWLGIGGLGALGVGGLALLKHLLGGFGYGSDSHAKAGKFMYGDKGQLSGVPTRQKGQKDVKEEKEKNLDKIRRGIEYVGRRDGDNKKKSSLGRQAVIKTNIMDENHLRIIREAIKDKQDKDKKLKPGAHKTPVDLHPTLNNEPTGTFRQ